MGYHVSILRTKNGQPSPISEIDVIAALKNSPQWIYEKSSSSATLSQPDKDDVCLWLQDGELWTKNPDERGIDAMITLANLLDARVRGDELETYRTSTETYVHPDDQAAAKQAQQINQGYARRARRRNFVFRSYQVLTLLTLIVLAAMHFLKKA
jgi:hypothetical protein